MENNINPEDQSEHYFYRPLQVFEADLKYSRKISFAFLFLVILSLLFFVFDENWCTSKNMLSILVFSIGLIPLMRWFYIGDLWSFPVFELFSLFVGVWFGLSSLLINDRISAISVDQREGALEIVLGGLLMSFFSYFKIAPFFFGSKRQAKIKSNISPKFLLRNSWIVVLLLLFYRIAFSSYGEQITFIEQPLLALGTFSFVFIYADFILRGEKKIENYVALIGLVFSQLLIGFSSGLLAEMAEVLILFGLVYLNIKKKVLFKTLFFCLFIFFLLNPLKKEMRSLTWSGSQKLNVVEKAQIFGGVIARNLSSSDFLDSRNEIVSRVDYTKTLGQVMAESPANVPYFLGGTYLPLLTVWIPRFLWPDKPTPAIGNEWAHYYGLVDTNDFTTSYNLCWLIEFYINFGVWGVLVGMFFCGFFFWVLKKILCSSPDVTLLEYSVAVTLLWRIWFAEGNFALEFGGVIIGSITLFIYFKALRFFERVKS